MPKKKTYKNKEIASEQVNETLPTYQANRIQFFKSFEEMEIADAKERAEVPYDKRLSNIEELRKMVFSNHLLADGNWPSIEKVFKIMPPYTNEISN